MTFVVRSLIMTMALMSLSPRKTRTERVKIVVCASQNNNKKRKYMHTGKRSFYAHASLGQALLRTPVYLERHSLVRVHARLYNVPCIDTVVDRLRTN